MALVPNQRLGPYAILSAVGAGGMGEVYRARDTRLDRIVAIKILPDHHAARPELRERFEREARTIASLNHSHICTLFDIGHQDGIDFLVMEYLEGETLAERLKKGPLPLDQALQYAIEISDALDKAHRKGITHRDLKPGNIMLTKSGAKLLDFGLAKLKQEAAPATPLSQLPTMKGAVTAEGTILGTLQYMAPEQLEAKDVDARTDIFAFGVVVYEMATGKKAFDGKSQASLIAKILETDPPPVSSLQPMTPPALDQVVKKCLAKGSSNGTRLVYVARQGGTQQLYLRAMDSLEAKPIPGTQGAASPFFSPDGQWVGFFAGGKLKKVSVSGGSALTLGDALTPRGASWGSQGTIAFGLAINSVLLQVTEDGGTPQPLTRREKGDISHRWPEFLPGGKAVLFGAGANALNFTNAQVAVQSLVTGERQNPIQGGLYPRYAPSGHLIYLQGESLMAVLFDLRRLAVTGTAVPVVDGALQSPISGAAQYSLSATGSLVYVSGGVQTARRKFVWVSRNGAEQPLAASAQDYRNPRLSPDGRRVGVTIQGQEDQIWLYDLSRETLTRFTFDGGTNQNPVWTPDGKRIAFYSTKEGPANIFWQLADGSGGLERLTTSDYTHVPKSFSPDGQLLAFHENNPKTNKDIWVLRLSDRKAETFLRTPFIEGAPTFSPDGHWLAYTSNESGRPEVYVQPYPGPGGKWQISTEGGTEPAWNRNGRELFYRSGDKMMVLDVTTQPSFSPGKPHLLFERRYFTSDFPLVGTAYDISSDGQRFLMVKDVEQATSVTQINVVLNWFEELKQKVPTGKK